MTGEKSIALINEVFGEEKAQSCENACFRQSGRRLRIDRVMKVTGKPIRTSVGLFFIGIAFVSAISILPGAKSAQSPFLYVCILGGLFVGIPAALGIGIVLENRRKRTPR